MSIASQAIQMTSKSYEYSRTQGLVTLSLWRLQVPSISASNSFVMIDTFSVFHIFLERILNLVQSVFI